MQEPKFSIQLTLHIKLRELQQVIEFLEEEHMKKARRKINSDKTIDSMLLKQFTVMLETRIHKEE